MKEFDVNDPTQVSSPTVIEADLGVGGRFLVVASGIMIADWEVDTDDILHGDDLLHLHIPADHIDGVTIHVGLASIANDDTGYVFAVDAATAEVDETTGELNIRFATAVMGETSSLNRYSYQLVASVRRDVAEVSGVVSWDRAFLDPGSALPSSVAPHLSIQLNTRTVVHHAPAGGFASDEVTLVPIAAGDVTAVTIDDGTVRAAYRVLNPPKGHELEVTVGLIGFTPPGGQTLSAAPDPVGVSVFTPTLSAPSRSDVDFVVRGTSVPR
jgi:hypothetical protein